MVPVACSIILGLIVTLVFLVYAFRDEGVDKPWPQRIFHIGRLIALRKFADEDAPIK